MTDFSDLLKKIKWLKQNDDIVKNIADEARLFAEKNFTSGGVELYVRKLLTAYSSRLKQTPVSDKERAEARRALARFS